MPKTLCIVCGNLRYVKPSHVVQGWGKYCSKQCQYLAQSTGKRVYCEVCGKEVYKNVSSLQRSKSGKMFCGKSCQAKWRNTLYRFERHANWVNGKASYRAILMRENRTLQCEKCQTTDERVLAVHHLDKNRDNNKTDNLIWLCHNCHYLVHHYDKESVGFIAQDIRLDDKT